MPKHAANLEDAVKESTQQPAGVEGEQVLKEAFVWHFSGTVDTQPWLFLEKATVKEVRTFFLFRDTFRSRHLTRP